MWGILPISESIVTSKYVFICTAQRVKSLEQNNYLQCVWEFQLMTSNIIVWLNFKLIKTIELTIFKHHYLHCIISLKLTFSCQSGWPYHKYMQTI